MFSTLKTSRYNFGDTHFCNVQDYCAKITRSDGVLREALPRRHFKWFLNFSIQFWQCTFTYCSYSYRQSR